MLALVKLVHDQASCSICKARFSWCAFDFGLVAWLLVRREEASELVEPHSRGRKLGKSRAWLGSGGSRAWGWATQWHSSPKNLPSPSLPKLMGGIVLIDLVLHSSLTHVNGHLHHLAGPNPACTKFRRLSIPRVDGQLFGQKMTSPPALSTPSNGGRWLSSHRWDIENFF